MTRFAELREHESLPRIVCVIDGFHHLPHRELLESLARKGRSYGIHLILIGAATPGASLFGQFPVRVALPGGSDVLDATNDAAAGLPLGTAVVNTASGLGGPRGATRGHERTIRFPDPHADRAALQSLRRDLFAARPPATQPPRIFRGYDDQRLDDDPTYQAAARGAAGRPTVLLGRALDVALSTAAYPLDGSPGRHLAIFSASPRGADLLDAAARSLAAQHPPGGARFVIISRVADGDALAATLAADLAERHEVHTGDLDPTGPAYVVVFGLDAGPALLSELRDAPARGLHVLAWSRTARKFDPEDAAGLVLLDIPGTELGVDWQPRPNRALLVDQHATRHAVFVPFGQSA